MKNPLLALLLPILLGVAACAQSEPVHADPDEIEAAVKEANEQGAAMKEKNGAS